MEIINEQEKVGEEKNPVMPYEDAKALYEAQLSNNRQFFINAARRDDTLGEVLLSGTQRFAQQIEQMPIGTRIYWGQNNISNAAIADWAVGAFTKGFLKTQGASSEMADILSGATKDVFSELSGTKETRKRGEQLIIAANRDLQELRARQQSETVKLRDSHPILDGLISTGEQYGAAMLMAYVPLVGPALSAAYMSFLEGTGTAIEGLEQYKEQHPEDKELKGFVSDEKSVKEFTLNTLKTFVNGCEEYVLGPAGQARYQMKMAKLAERGFKPMRYGALRYAIKRGAIGAAQEFTEEGLLQGTSDTIFDYLLGRYKSGDEAVKAWKENLAQAGFAALYGGVFGVGGAIMDRAKGIEATRELLKDVVAEQDLDKVATVVFENELNNVMDIATVATEISSQLNTQKGEIYDALRSAAFQAAKESGGYKGLTDESLWAHVNEVSERFAQEAVAEAFKRNVPIQEVIDSHDIVYKDGELHLAKTDGESNLGKKIGEAAERSKTMKEQADLAQTMYQLDQDNPQYTGETIDIGGVQKTVYNADGNRIAQSAEALQAFYNWFGDSKVVDEQGRPMIVYHGSHAKFDAFSKEFIGKGRGKLWGNGFYFTNSKARAEQLSKGFFGQGTNAYVYQVYLKMENPLVDGEMGAIGEEYDGRIQHGAGTTTQENYYVVKEPNQIKSTSNRGTYSSSENIYYQDGYEVGYEVKKVDKDQNLSEFRNKNEEYNKKAKDYFGTTYRMAEAGYILTDGELLDFSGKKFGGPAGQRTMDHRQVNEIDVSMEDFINSGNIRFMPEGDKILMSNYPTQKQFDMIRRAVGLSRGTFTVELMSDAQKWGMNRNDFYGEYEYGTPFTKIKRDIDAFYKGAGVRPEMAFYQSAYAGSRVDYDRPSLKYIGSNTGVQTYGYGLYYTLERPYAERYRRGIDYSGHVYNDVADYIVEKLSRESGVNIDKDDAIKIMDGRKDEVLKTYDFSKTYQDAISKINPKTITKEYGDYSKKVEGYDVGQVVEVDIPENPFLLDDDKTLANQPQYVKERIEKANKELNLGIKDKAIYGYKVYDEISKKLGSDKQASQYLEKLGIKGIKYYEPAYDGHGFVIFNPDDVKVIQKFYQDQEQRGRRPKGMFDANSKVIKLFERADASTLDHELAHFWLDNMWTYAKSGNANPQYVAQFNAVRDFLGVKPEQENLTRAQHEKFASAYEKYLYRGEFPTPIMGTVFANYERFIRDVYQSINDIRAQGKSKVRLTSEIIQFFDSMTSGELPTDLATTEMLNETRAEEVHQYDSKVVETVKKEVVPPESTPVAAPEATVKEILPVGSSGEVAESRLAKRTTEAMGIESDLQYERANIEQERAKAAEMWKNDPQKAQAELNNATMGNEVLRNALYTEQQRIAIENGDRDTFLKSLRKQSAEATRAGQELAALRGVVEDITMPSYWIRLAEWEAQKQLAKNMATYFDKVMGNTPLLNFTQKFDADVKALYEKVRKAETNAEKSKIMKEGLDEMKKTYRGLNQQEVGELFQTDWTNEELAYDYVEKKARDAVGLNLTNEKANAIIQASRDLDKLSRNVDEFGLPTAQFFAKKSELEYLINSHTPSSQTKVLLSTLGRANMLTAPATSVLNVASNVQNYGAQTLVRRLNNAITKHTNDNLVDSNLRKQYRKRVWDTFWATGYDLSMMNSIADTRLYRGESAVNSAGKGVIRQAGQWAEKHIFGELISSPDMVFKSYLAFTDFAGNEATDIAYKEGLTGDKAKERANELFADAVKIEPKTEIGKQIRAKAQADALVITFQQDTKLARALLDLRNIVNKATGDVGVGDLLSAFVKTPANVLALGYDATVGPFGHLVNTFGAIQDARAGNLTSARVMATIKQTTTMAVMQAIVAAFALGFIDDDDYIPDYSQLSPSERLIVKERGASFGSIRIGDTYISTDFFGPFEVPLTAWLNARRQQGFADSASAYIGSVLRKGLDAPVIKDLLDQAKAAENVGSDSLSIWEHIYDTAGNLLISRLTPNVMNTLAKMTDDYERETNKSVLNKLIARVPVARKTLAPKMSVSTGNPVETPSALMQLLFGSRAHKLVDSTVSNELYRLYQAGERATISDITRSGDLKLIDEKEKQSAKEWFAREYSKAAERAIKTSTYRRKSDEDKKDELNKIRRDLVKQLKEKYKKKISVAKQKK